MKIIESEQVNKYLTMEKCMEIMKEALVDLETGKCIQPIRFINQLPHNNKFGFMPAYLGDNDYFGAKVITAFHSNLGTSYPSHMGYVMLFESTHGSLVGMVDATSITQIRTGAVSGVATDLLARKDAKLLALIGAGAQARAHLESILLVRDIKEVYVYDIKEENAKHFQHQMSELYSVIITVKTTVEDAVKGADIICTLTPSVEPFLKAEWVKPGTHINAVGTFSPNTREVTSELVANSKLFADSVEAMKNECGEFIIPKEEGLINDTHIIGSIGEILMEKIKARTSDDEITLFDALGLAVEDVACAKYMCCLEVC